MKWFSLFQMSNTFSSFVQSGRFKQNLNIGKNLNLNFELYFILVFRVDKAFARGKGISWKNEISCFAAILKISIT